MDERPVPGAALRDKNSIELLSVWIAENGMHCSIKIGLYNDSDVSEVKAWGIILADLTRHLSDGLKDLIKDGNIKEEISKYYLEELNKPTSPATGSFVN